MKFKTSIHCASCVAKVTPVLEGIPEIEKWEVDTENPDKILTVKGGDAENIIRALKKIGYQAEKIESES
jgi:copper chaperone